MTRGLADHPSPLPPPPVRPPPCCQQLSLTDKVANSLALGTSPIVRSLFDPEGGMRDVRALDNVSFTGGWVLPWRAVLSRREVQELAGVAGGLGGGPGQRVLYGCAVRLDNPARKWQGRERARRGAVGRPRHRLACAALGCCMRARVHAAGREEPIDIR